MAKDPRKAHILRCYQKNTDGSQNLDVWIDVLRLDTYKMQQRPTYQSINNVDKWGDAPGDPPNADRKLDKLMITNPQNKTQIVEVDIIRQMKVTNNQTGQATVVVYYNGDDNVRRKSVTKRVQHREVDDTSLDFSKPVPMDDYLKALDASPDASQYLDVEVPKDFWMNDDDLTGTEGKSFYVMQNRLNSNDLIALMIDVPPSGDDST